MSFRTRVRRRLHRHLDANFGPHCRLGCGQRVHPKDVRAHEDTNHAGDLDPDLVDRTLFYPANDGTPILRDPTYGRVDRDIQWRVHDTSPSSLGVRVATENNLQRRRDEERGRGGDRC